MNESVSRGVLYRAQELDDDLKFVVKTWLRDYLHPRNPWAGSFHRPAAMHAAKTTIMSILMRDNSHVVVASSENDRAHIYGFCCFERGHEFPVLHYVYVKAAFRGCNIGSDLIAIARGSSKEPIRHTFRTPCCRKFLRGARFAPGLVRTGGESYQ
jgi:hypothetical protein